MVKEFSTDYDGIWIIHESGLEADEKAYSLEASNGDGIDLDHYPTPQEIEDFAYDMREQY